MHVRRSIVAIVVCASLIAACGGASTSSPNTTPNTRALVDQVLTHCTDLAAPELGKGTLCIDNGFRLKSDDFSFKNWGLSTSAEGNATAQTLVDLFGHDAICVPGASNTCILRPTAIQKLEEWNTALNGGRCEGLATLSTRFLMKLDTPSTFQRDAANVSQLQRDNPALNSSIVYWWATQFLNEVTDHAAATRQRTPLELVNELIQGLAHSVGYTVGMYDGASGHSVTPFAVTHRNNDFVVHVYDNNHPGKRLEILVNAKTNRWRYPNAFHNLDGSSHIWSGGVGSFELTSMSTRKGPFQCPFCNTPLTNAPTVISIASRDIGAAGFVEVKSSAGEIRASPTGITNSIQGATYTVGKGNAGGLITVTIPHAVSDFNVRLLRESKDIPAADVVLGLRRPDGASIQISGDIAHDVLDDNTTSPALIAVQPEKTIVHAPSQNVARLSLSAGSHITRRTLNANEEMVIRNISENGIEVSLKGATGAVSPFKKISLDSSTTTELTVSIDEAGRIILLPSRIEPVQVSSPGTRNFTPRKANQTTTTSVPSIEISEPD